jgi:hypothetical protein
MADIKYEIVKELGVISTNARGWNTELNMVSWNDAPAKYDIRPWSPDHSRMGKGITLTEEELLSLAELIRTKDEEDDFDAFAEE